MKEISDSYTACAVAENLSNSNNNALQVIESISEDLVL